FHDQPRRKAHQRRAQIALFALAVHQCLQTLARPLGCGYPAHRGAPSSEVRRQTGPRGFANQATVHPNPFSSNPRTSSPKMPYVLLIEFRPNDLALPRIARLTDDILPKSRMSRLR